MSLEDLHTHTCYCDGKDTPENMVMVAIEKGLKTIGFSGHIYLDHGTDYCMSKENTQKYITKINALKKKYKGKINILCGIEADLYSDEDLSEFDYIIGSVHDIKTVDGFFSVDDTASIFKSGVEKYFDGDYYTVAQVYFESVVECIKKTDADIIGHFDLLSKFNEKENWFDEKHPRYVAAYKKAVDALIPYGKTFEINTGAMSRGYRTVPYPAPDILRYIAQNGGKVILTGDTHAKENLCYGFIEAENIAKKAGFEKLCCASDIIKQKTS